MADVIITSDRSTSASLNGSNDAYFLAEGVSHYSSGTALSILDNGSTQVEDMQIFVNGTMTGLDGGGIFHSNASDVVDLTIQISSSGRIFSSSQLNAIGIATDASQILNNGELSGGAAVVTSGEDNRITNNGIMASVYSGFSLVHAVSIFGDNSLFFNNGTVTGRQGVQFFDDAFMSNSGLVSATGVAVRNSLSTGEVFVFQNTGTVNGGENAILASNGDDQIRNSGALIGDVALDDGANLFISTGTVEGDISAGTSADRIVIGGEMVGDITTNLGADTVTVTGTLTGDIDTAGLGDTLSIGATGSITGNVTVGDSSDTVTMSGRINGTLDLGTGNDALTIGGTGFVSGGVTGGFGDDTITGGELGDNFDGGNQDDLLIGRGGDDTLSGGQGNDTLLGGSGNDNLQGVEDTNVLNGQNGNDVIVGGTGDDRMFGGNGDDTLTSGTGADILRGDAGEDVFVFRSVADTGTGSTRDRIIGFEDGRDLIDLTGFGSIAFSATGAIGSGTASVWFQSISSGAQTMLRIDTNGDGNFDGQVLLVRTDPALLDQSDLILG